MNITTINAHFHALSAAQNGLLDELKNICTSGLYQPLVGRITTAANTNLLAIAAATGGQLAVLIWLVKRSGLPLDLTAQHNSTLCHAVESGDFELVRWIVLESGHPVDVTAADIKHRNNRPGSEHAKIDEFLKTVSELHKAGVTIDQLQLNPALIDPDIKSMSEYMGTHVQSKQKSL